MLQFVNHKTFMFIDHLDSAVCGKPLSYAWIVVDHELQPLEIMSQTENRRTNLFETYSNIDINWDPQTWEGEGEGEEVVYEVEVSVCRGTATLGAGAVGESEGEEYNKA